MIRKIIYLLGTLVYNSNIFNNYKFLIKNQYNDIEEIQKYQFRKLIDLLGYAYNNSRYYRDKFKACGFDPAQINSLDDIKQIPILTKEEVLDNAESIQVKNCNEKLFYSETSGSTGRPLVFFRNKDWDAWHRASVLRGESWYGVEPWDKNGYFWGFNFSFSKRLKTRLLDYLQNRFRLFSYKDADIERFIKKLKNASYLEGYSSMIYEVAKKVNSNDSLKARFKLKMIKGTSEKIFDKYQSEVQAAFGQRIISEYGAAEAGIIAFECKEGNMHINMETVIVEEENNEIIVTNLVSSSFPIIRYKLGDYIEIDKSIKCSCGMNHYIIKEIKGRVGKVIAGHESNYPSLTLYYVFKNLAMGHGIILNYQAVQRRKGHLTIRLEQHLTKEEMQLLKEELFKYYENDLDIEVLEGANLKSETKKKVDFISELHEV